MRRHTLRTYTGQYKKQRMWNRDRKTWFEVMCLAVLAIWGAVAADIHPIAEAYYSIPDKIVIVRESSVFTAEAARAGNDHGEFVQADSWKEALKEERDGTPLHDVVSLSNESIEGKIREAWIGTGQEDVAVAVAKSESGLRTDAMGWNCYYYNAQGKRYSAACRPEDREKAWSVDCGVMQINHIGKTCPAYLFDPDENIKLGKEKYDSSDKRIGIGFYPWMAYRNNLHLKYL